MSETMVASPTSPEVEFVAFVGIDWADKEHAWILEESATAKRQRGKLQQSPEAIDEWAVNLLERFAGGSIAVAVEQSRGALICGLLKYPHLIIYPVHPRTSSQYRTALFPSGAKDDPGDAELLLDLLTRHRDHLHRLRPDTEQTRELQSLVEKRRQLVDERTAQGHRITAHLKLYFPQILTWFDEVTVPVVHAFLDRWPTLLALQAERQEVILEFLHAHNCRAKSRNEVRLREIPVAQPLTTDAAIVRPAVLMVKTCLEMVAVLRAGITAVEEEIAKICAAHEDYALFASFPGAGPALAPRLLAACGTQRDRFSNAGQLQAFSGIAPVISRSGQSQWIHFRWACPKFLRQTFHEYAAASIKYSAWAREYYGRQRAKGKGHHAIIRALAFKWIRIIFRCWKDRTPYSESHYQAALSARPTPDAVNPHPAPSAHLIPDAVDKAANFLFKESGGFWKFSRGAS